MATRLEDEKEKNVATPLVERELGWQGKDAVPLRRWNRRSHASGLNAAFAVSRCGLPTAPNEP